jgi:hypothetical protein
MSRGLAGVAICLAGLGLAAVAAETPRPSLQSVSPGSAATSHDDAAPITSIGARRFKPQEQAAEFERLLREAPDTLVIVAVQFQQPMSAQHLAALVQQYDVLELDATLKPLDADDDRFHVKLINDGSSMAAQLDQQFCAAKTLLAWVPKPTPAGVAATPRTPLDRQRAETSVGDVGNVTLRADRAQALLAATNDVKRGFVVAAYPQGSTEEVRKARVAVLSKPVRVPQGVSVPAECSRHVEAASSPRFVPRDAPPALGPPPQTQ